jgi:hypothetical protein
VERLVLKLETTLFQRTTEAKDDQQEPVQTFRDLRKDFGYSRVGSLCVSDGAGFERLAIRIAPSEFKRLQAGCAADRRSLAQRIDRWNAHDIDGCLDAYWKSPELLVVIDSEQFNGWQQLHDSYVNGHLGATAMGFIQPKRIQVRLLKPDLALALTWWTINFPNSHQKVVGTTTMNLRKFDDGWKIVASHSNTNVM